MKWNCRVNVTVMAKASSNVLWEVRIGVSGQGGAPIGPSPLLKINKSPTIYIQIYINIPVLCQTWIYISNVLFNCGDFSCLTLAPPFAVYLLQIKKQGCSQFVHNFTLMKPLIKITLHYLPTRHMLMIATSTPTLPVFTEIREGVPTAALHCCTLDTFSVLYDIRGGNATLEYVKKWVPHTHLEDYGGLTLHQDLLSQQ